MTTSSGLDSLFHARYSRLRRIRNGASSDVKDYQPLGSTAARGTLVGADPEVVTAFAFPRRKEWRTRCAANGGWSQ